VTFKISLDSSIIISHLSGDVHKEEVLACVDRLASIKAEVFMSLVCYAEVWTGIVIKLKTAKQIGLTVLHWLSIRAETVIKRS
jgi:predicted nucleic acid-binding protein